MVAVTNGKIVAVALAVVDGHFASNVDDCRCCCCCCFYCSLLLLNVVDAVACIFDKGLFFRACES